MQSTIARVPAGAFEQFERFVDEEFCFNPESFVAAVFIGLASCEERQLKRYDSLADVHISGAWRSRCGFSEVAERYGH